MQALIFLILGNLCEIISSGSSSSAIFNADEALSYFDGLELDKTSDTASKQPNGDVGDNISQYFRKYYRKISDSPEPSNSQIQTSRTEKGGYGKIDISIQYGFANPPDQPQQAKNDNFSDTPATEIVEKKPEPMPIRQQEFDVTMAKQIGSTSRLEFPPILSYHYDEPVEPIPLVFRATTSSNYRGYKPSPAPDDGYKAYSNNKIVSKRYNLPITTTTQRAIANKPYNYHYNDTSYKDFAHTTEQTPNKNHYYTNAQKHPSPPQEQYYSVQNTAFYPSMNPYDNKHRGPVPSAKPYGFENPANRGYIHASPSDRNIAVSSTPVPSLQSINVETSNVGQTGGLSVQPTYFLTHITPRSVLHDVNRIVIENSPTKEVYIKDQTEAAYTNNEDNLNRHAYMSADDYTQETQAYPTFQPTYNYLSPTFRNKQDEFNSEVKPAAPTMPPVETTRGSQEMVERYQHIFNALKAKCFDLFVRGTMEDFRKHLFQKIEEKCAETLPEEDVMLSTEFDGNKDANGVILDYLTVYERYSDVLNNTELSTHILQDIDRAKEYLNMKLNKFWQELDAMETPEEFEDKRDYYRNREKPSGIMNLFYEWFEKLACDTNSVDENEIRKRLISIMKKERRYWLLLLKN